MTTTQTDLIAALRNYGEKACALGSGIHVPQFGRMTQKQARALLAQYEEGRA